MGTGPKLHIMVDVWTGPFNSFKIKNRMLWLGTYGDNTVGNWGDSNTRQCHAVSISDLNQTVFIAGENILLVLLVAMPCAASGFRSDMPLISMEEVQPSLCVASQKDPIGHCDTKWTFRAQSYQHLGLW